jgi:hypothetical protein
VIPEECHQTISIVVNVGRNEWYSEPQLYTRDDATGLWERRPTMSSSVSCAFHYTTIQPPVSDEEVPVKLFVSNLNSDSQTFISNAEKVIEPALVMVDTDMPSSGFIDGVYARHFSRTGMVVYHSKTMGIVAVDKDTMPISVSDVNLEFASNLMNIPGDVVFLHPIHSYALIAYDSSALGPTGAAAVRAAVLCPQPALQKGDIVYLVGLNQSSKSQSRKSTVKNTVAALNIRQCAYPRYRAMKMEVIKLDTDLGNSFFGVLTDEHGKVWALLGSFSTQVKYSDSLDDLVKCFL